MRQNEEPRTEETTVICGYVRGKILVTFKGEEICAIREVSTWRTPRSYVSTTMTAYRAVKDGYVWHGRGAGESMRLVLRRGRKVHEPKRRKVGRADVLRVVSRCGLLPLVTTAASGAAYVTGARSELDRAVAEFLRLGYSPRYVTSYKVDGAEQTGYPRLEFHPQIMSR